MTKKWILHDNIAQALEYVLDKIMYHGEYADKFVPIFIQKQKKWGSRDRKVFAQIIYATIRNFRFNQEVLKQQKVDTSIQNIIAIEIENNFPEFITNRPAILSKDEGLPDVNQYRFPEWLQHNFLQDYPEMTINDFSLLDQKAKTYIRVNTLKISKMELFSILSKDLEVRIIEEDIDALEVPTNNNLSHSALYKNGYFEFQDLASQRVAYFAELESACNVLDMCAGAGGKSLHLSAVMNNKGKIYATDVDESRLARLEERMKKSGAKNIKLIDYQDIGKYPYDVILIDAPCSGTGTWKRQPDAKWKISEEFVKKNRDAQIEILNKASSIIKVSGKIVFITCSVLKDEGERQIEKFLESNHNFILQKSYRSDCFHKDEDGFYMALLLKK